ncbi:hypothetical protein Glove_590g10 [Diversispora epigaea]|uniref:Uncharacterized protein n=1 Tax=Diversispora epigaea TaxID=1348612 RepID=A0A397GB76_9GLOM|nr:hypothetical protein Glove_590g10 [Diversispora epigaea]
MKEWEEIHSQFVQIFSQAIEKKTLLIPQVNIPPKSSKRQFPISVLPNDPEKKQQHVVKMVLGAIFLFISSCFGAIIFGSLTWGKIAGYTKLHNSLIPTLTYFFS